MKPLLFTLDIDSMPPTRKQLPESVEIFPAATWMASIEEPHNLLNVAPGTVSGNPLRKDTSLPTL